jgi:hypothetical protein
VKIIPITATPSQTLNTVLANQICKINLYQKSTGVFADVYLNGVALVTGALCPDRVNVMRRKYLGFVGGLALCDTQGVSDAQYAGFGTRYVLVYLEAADLA